MTVDSAGEKERSGAGAPSTRRSTTESGTRKERSEQQIPRLLIVLRGIPHYRRALFEALADLAGRRLFVAYDPEYLSDSGSNAIVSVPASQIPRCRVVPHKKAGPLSWQRGVFRVLSESKPDALIVLGDPRILSTWLLLLRRHVMVSMPPVLLWTHGWTRHDPLSRRIFKKLFFGAADGILVYADRARVIGQSQGYSGNHLHVIHNSVEHEQDILDRLQQRHCGLQEADMKADPNAIRIICVSRVTADRELSDLVAAQVVLQQRGVRTETVIVGEGADKDRLASEARRLGVQLHLVGACYDRCKLDAYYRQAHISVVTGRAGLAVIQAMGHGLPVIAHNDFENQMPEVEAIVPQRTGAFYERGSGLSLANSIQEIVALIRGGVVTPGGCMERVLTRYTAEAQASAMLTAVNTCLQDSKH